VADIFVSYTLSDREWAFWIGKELQKLGHTPHVHEWEIPGGGDIEAWMEDRHDNADKVLCVVSDAYLKAPHSSRERRSAQWAIDRPNFALPVFIEDCKARTLFANIKRCDIYGISEEDARSRLNAFLMPAAMPAGPVKFPGMTNAAEDDAKSTAPVHVDFPGRIYALSNIPIGVPRHFLGRGAALAAIDAALGDGDRHVPIAALHGLRGVGKTTLAAAYAEYKRDEYRATWWIRAETESTMRADLVGLGVRLGWIPTDEKEEPALASVMERLRNEGDGILLVYDNANNAGEVRPYIPRSGAARVIVTSTAPDWNGIAALVELEVWSKEIGADYLTERTGRFGDRDEALALSEALGGLPLAHEQASAYCARVGLRFADYLTRFEANPGKLPGTQKDAPYDYGRTVATTFALAIDQAAKLHPAAEALIVCAALLAPEPIPLFLFSEAREKFGEPLASGLADDGLEEMVGALRAFALVDRELIPDERDSSIKTDSIRLHRLVRRIVVARCSNEVLEDERRKLIEALVSVYPARIFDDPVSWPRARRLDALASAVVDEKFPASEDLEELISYLLHNLALYRMGPLAAYRLAYPLLERALVIDEKILGSDHPNFAAELGTMGYLLQAQGDLHGAKPYFERALSIREKVLGPDHPDTSRSLSNLGALLDAQGDFAGSRPYHERALAVREKTLGPDHRDTANSLNNFGGMLQEQGDFSGAQAYFERALAIREKVLGPDHPDTAKSLNNLGSLLVKARQDFAGALIYLERALLIMEKALGSGHPLTERTAANLAVILQELGRTKEAKALRERYTISD
jgi:tetratricopeptide (TPR) repeat protein